MAENQGGSGPKPGWYPDPENPSKQRYWDGSKWTGQETTSPAQSKGTSLSGIIAGYRRLPTWTQILLPILAVVVVVMIANEGKESSGSGDSGGKSEASQTSEDEGDTEAATVESEEDHGNPAENASDSNTPVVGPNGSVEVDTLRWRLDDSKATQTIGSQEYGLGAKANGIFVVANLSVTNNKDESVTLTSENVSLVAGENTYSADSEAEFALADAFVFEDLGPGVTADGSVGFDVAPSVLHQHPQLRFNELGFGDTHGYIILPPLTG